MENKNYDQDFKSLALHLEYIARMCPDKLDEAMTFVQSINNQLKQMITTYGN